MANTYYDSQLTAAEIEAALEAVDGLIAPANNGKVVVVENGALVAKSVSEWLDIDLQAKTVTLGSANLHRSKGTVVSVYRPCRQAAGFAGCGGQCLAPPQRRAVVNRCRHRYRWRHPAGRPLDGARPVSLHCCRRHARQGGRRLAAWQHERTDRVFVAC